MTSLIACTNKPENTTEYVFYTQDSLYKITFDKPAELDTFYTWKDEDDNVCSDEHKYRFSRSNFPPQKETGFFWTSFADSTYRITLKHVEGYVCKSEMNFEKMIPAAEYPKILATRAESMKQKLDFLYLKEEKINGITFRLCAYRLNENYKNGYWTHYIKGTTIIDSNIIVFEADCRAKNCDNFIDRMEKTISTVKIKKK